VYATSRGLSFREAPHSSCRTRRDRAASQIRDGAPWFPTRKVFETGLQYPITRSFGVLDGTELGEPPGRIVRKHIPRLVLLTDGCLYRVLSLLPSGIGRFGINLQVALCPSARQAALRAEVRNSSYGDHIESDPVEPPGDDSVRVC
jgi:hypothetical protein